MSRKLLTSNNWKRHSVIESSSDLGKLIHTGSPKIISELLDIRNSLIIVSTYDCAVISDNFETEPWLQVLIAIPTEAIKVLKNGRNPRVIHIPILKDESLLNYEITAKGLYQVDRQIIVDKKPSYKFNLEEEASHILKIWLAERFRKDSWSDDFESALKPAEKKLKRFFQKYKNHISGIYLSCTGEAKQPYELKAIIAVEDNKLHDLNKKVRDLENAPDLTIDQIYEILSNQFKNALGESVTFAPDTTKLSNIAIEVKSESGLSLADIRNYKLYSPYKHSEYEQGDPFPVDTTKV